MLIFSYSKIAKLPFRRYGASVGFCGATFERCSFPLSSESVVAARSAWRAEARRRRSGRCCFTKNTAIERRDTADRYGSRPRRNLKEAARTFRSTRQWLESKQG